MQEKLLNIKKQKHFGILFSGFPNFPPQLFLFAYINCGKHNSISYSLDTKFVQKYEKIH